MKLEMEYNLLKTIESNFGSFRVPNENLPKLTPFPGTDYVNPGLGQISRLYSFYVPMYSNKNVHTLQKKVADTNAQSLEGFGNIAETTEEPKDETIKDTKSESDEIESQLRSNPLEFNANKRKKLGEPIHESFLHPKLIKTDKLFINSRPESKKKPSSNASSSKTSNKPIKHKFEIY